MAKPHRGRSLWKMDARGKGTCPLCRTARIKLLHTKIGADGKQIQVCKRCKNRQVA